MTGSVNRILISRMKFIGDIVLTTPIIHAVRERYPEAYIAYLGEKEAVSLLEHNPHLDEIIPYDFSLPAFLQQPRVMWQLRKRKFDVVVDLFSNPRTAILSYASGAQVRIGKEVKGRGNLYTHRIQDDGKPKTAVEFHYQYVQPIGVQSTQSKTEIFLTDEEKLSARKFLASMKINVEKPIVGLHPGATWPAKMWQWERFVELGELLITDLSAEVVVTQGPKDGTVVKNLFDRSSGNLKVLPVMPLRTLAAVLSQFSVYVANDSGPMHIAVAVGTKTIGIFGAGEEYIWFPYVPPYYPASSLHIALRKNVPCHPCHLDFCNREGEGYMECMKLLTVDEVFEHVKERLRT